MKLPNKPTIAATVGLLVLLAGIVSYLLLRKEPLDLSKEEAPFPSIAMPPRAVYGAMIMDGGSIYVHLVDRDGATYGLTFLIDPGAIRDVYPTALAGPIFNKTPVPLTPVPLKNPARAKEIAIRLLDEYGKESDSPEDAGENYTARARRELASPPDRVVARGLEKLKEVFGFD